MFLDRFLFDSIYFENACPFLSTPINVSRTAAFLILTWSMHSGLRKIRAIDLIILRTEAGIYIKMIPCWVHLTL